MYTVSSHVLSNDLVITSVTMELTSYMLKMRQLVTLLVFFSVLHLGGLQIEDDGEITIAAL